MLKRLTAAKSDDLPSTSIDISISSSESRVLAPVPPESSPIETSINSSLVPPLISETEVIQSSPPSPLHSSVNNPDDIDTGITHLPQDSTVAAVDVNEAINVAESTASTKKSTDTDTDFTVGKITILRAIHELKDQVLATSSPKNVAGERYTKDTSVAAFNISSCKNLEELSTRELEFVVEENDVSTVVYCKTCRNYKINASSLKSSKRCCASSFASGGIILDEEKKAIYMAGNAASCAKKKASLVFIQKTN